MGRRMRSMDFIDTLYIQKMFIRVQGNVWYNLEGHTTRRNDFKAGKSDFCRFFKNDTPKSQNNFWKICNFFNFKKVDFHVSPQKKVDAIWKNGNVLEGVPCDEF